MTETCVVCKKTCLPPPLMALNEDVSLAICEPCAENLGRFFIGGELAKLQELEKLVRAECDKVSDDATVFLSSADKLLAALDKRRAAIREMNGRPGRWKRAYVDQFTIDKIVAMLDRENLGPQGIREKICAMGVPPDENKIRDALVPAAEKSPFAALADMPESPDAKVIFTEEEVRAWHAGADHEPVAGGGVCAMPATGLVRVHCKWCGKPYRTL